MDAATVEDIKEAIESLSVDDKALVAKMFTVENGAAAKQDKQKAETPSEAPNDAPAEPKAETPEPEKENSEPREDSEQDYSNNLIDKLKELLEADTPQD